MTTHKPLYLVCNAHLDPVWLWKWDEGLAETLSTFRGAARFCEEFEGFVFCHNESLLYKWVEEFDPGLFERIYRCVQSGKWHIMGGWFVQPDCNMPSGESLVRQILTGRKYFSEKFSRQPHTAINFDPFGHSRGLVQILKKSGYTSYVFCRPGEDNFPLLNDDFVWVGYDGSEILAHRPPGHYNSSLGDAAEKIKQWLTENSDRQDGILLWGIGNHGGGPSSRDLEDIEVLISGEKDWEITHGTPEQYFSRLESRRNELPRIEKSLNPWAVGCYTSMARVKQKHRQLESSYFTVEMMAANAALQGLETYPQADLDTALEDLLFCQFHDILPGSSIPEVEAYALQRLDHALEIIERLRVKTFFALLSGQESAGEGEFPLFVYNPHPFELECVIECELQPLEPNFLPEVFMMPQLTDAAGRNIPFQLEKESSNIALDHRKRLVFDCTLKAAAMNRFACHLVKTPAKKIVKSMETGDEFVFASDCFEVTINAKTGWIDSYRVDGADYLKHCAFEMLVIKDSADPWGMKVRSFREVDGFFELMNRVESAQFAGVDAEQLSPVRIIEDGVVRTVVEALFRYRRSAVCMRYKIPKSGAEIEVELRVHWMEKDSMLKLSVPTCLETGRCSGQTAYGVEEFDRCGEELAAQKWVMVTDESGDKTLTIINDRTYGFDFQAGELRLSLLRSPAYSGHPVGLDIPIVPQDRFEPRLDQGEHLFRFWLNAGAAQSRSAAIDREAAVKNSPPQVLCAYPQGTGSMPKPGVYLSDETVVLTAMKYDDTGKLLIIRLFEPTGRTRQTTVSIPALNLEYDVSLDKFEIKTIAVDVKTGNIHEVNLLEERLSAHECG